MGIFVLCQKQLTDEPETYFFFSVAHGNISEMIFALNRLSELACPTMSISESALPTSPASSVLGASVSTWLR